MSGASRPLRFHPQQMHPLSLTILLLVMFAAGIAVAVWQEFPLLQCWLKAWAEASPVPSWLDISHLPPWYVLSLPFGLMGLAWGLTKLSPKPRVWSRALMVAILLALMIRYVVWRTLTTLNFDSTLNGLVSVGFWAMELLLLAGQALQFSWMLKLSDRTPQANIGEHLVRLGDYRPSVDILIPTYDEPVAILQRTLVGCQALDYENFQIYLLDDTRRPEVKALAHDLGCHYLTRPNNLHAKAGNLNHGLGHCQGDLVVVFDADFVPTENFLKRTVGFFADPQVGLVQTYQSFFNHDPIARNLGLTETLPQEVEIFSRHYQRLRDGLQSAICYGSGFLVRRSALEAVGQFDTDTLSEDYLTGVRLSGAGFEVIYLGESLSAGLCANDLAGHIQQRLRWARGSLQSFFVPANPLTLPGLTWEQRLAHLEGLIQWLHSPIRLTLLLLPLFANGLGIIPIATTIPAWLYYSLPFYLVTLTSFVWLNGRSRSAVMSDVYSVLQCVPLTLTVFHTLFFPFARSFTVTPKGRHAHTYRINWQIAGPLVVLWLASLLSCGLAMASVTVWGISSPSWSHLGLIWSLYNLVILGLAIWACVDAPTIDGFDWFKLQSPLPVTVTSLAMDDQNQDSPIFSGKIRLLSEGGAVIQLDHADTVGAWGDMVTLELLNTPLTLSGQVSRPFSSASQAPQSCEMTVMFSPLSIRQYRQLLRLLFCQPGQWAWPQSQGELVTLGHLLKALLFPAWRRFPRGHLTPVTIANSADRICLESPSLELSH